MLFVQGSRDSFGTPSELSPVLAGLAPAPILHVVAGGDHSLKVSRRDPKVQAAVYDDVQRTIAEWMLGTAAAPRPQGFEDLRDRSADYSSGCTVIKYSVTTRALHEVFADNSLEHRRIAFSVPGAFRIDHGDRSHPRRYGGSWPWCGEHRPGQRGPAPSAGASGTSRPPPPAPCRSTWAWSDRSTERCAAAQPARRSPRRFPRSESDEESDTEILRVPCLPE